jgi:hypothetical protein
MGDRILAGSGSWVCSAMVTPLERVTAEVRRQLAGSIGAADVGALTVVLPARLAEEAGLYPPARSDSPRHTIEGLPVYFSYEVGGPVVVGEALFAQIERDTVF